MRWVLMVRFWAMVAAPERVFLAAPELKRSARVGADAQPMMVSGRQEHLTGKVDPGVLIENCVLMDCQNIAAALDHPQSDSCSLSEMREHVRREFCRRRVVPDDYGDARLDSIDRTGEGQTQHGTVQQHHRTLEGVLTRKEAASST